MSLLVFGKTGQVARELMRLVPEARFVGRDEVNLENAEACAALIRQLEPEQVINAAAYTAVDRAEEDEALALRVNGDAPTAMAQACARMGARLVHISTDYVFDGSGSTPWREEDPVAPLGAYGRTKLAGEQGVQGAGGVHAILRTSWVFSAHGGNFVKTMLRLGAERDRLSIVGDQIGGPTPAAAIAAACLSLARELTPATSGIYHYSGAPDVSWADFARAIFDAVNQSVEVVDISSSDYPTPAVRPINSRLDCTKLETAFKLPRPGWQNSLLGVINKY